MLRNAVLSDLDADAVIASVEGAAIDQHAVAGFPAVYSMGVYLEEEPLAPLDGPSIAQSWHHMPCGLYPIALIY